MFTKKDAKGGANVAKKGVAGKAHSSKTLAKHKGKKMSKGK